MILAVVVLNFDVFYSCGSAVPAYFGGCLVIFALAAFVELALTVTSMRGSIMDTKPRICLFLLLSLVNLAGVIGLLHIHTFCVVLEVAFNVLGTYLLFIGTDYCMEAEGDVSLVILSKIIVISCWVHLFLVLIGFSCIFNPILSSHSDDLQISTMSGIWGERLRYLFCCAGISPILIQNNLFFWSRR